MNKNFNPYTIKFVNSGDVIEKVEDGHSGALIYKITKGKEKFLLKIFNEKFNEKKIRKIKKSLSIYKKLEIKSLDIIDYGNIENYNKYYIVYNFIEGKNLKIYTNSDKYNLEDIRKYGEFIGKELLKLKKYKNYDKDLFKCDDINILVEKSVNNFYSILKDDNIKNIVTKYFVMDDIDKLKYKLIEYANLLKNTEMSLIHGDIKRANVIIDENQELYIIDIESMQLNYDITNFEYQITWCLDSKKEFQFVKGYFDGIYNGTRPTNFNKHVIFILIINFFNASCTMYNKKQIEKLIMYMKKCRKLFETLNKKDLAKEFII